MKPSGVAKLETLLFGRALTVALARDLKTQDVSCYREAVQSFWYDYRQQKTPRGDNVRSNSGALCNIVVDRGQGSSTLAPNSTQEQSGMGASAYVAVFDSLNCLKYQAISLVP